MLQTNTLVTIEVHRLKKILELVLEIEGMFNRIKIPAGVKPTLQDKIDEIKKIFQEEVRVK